MPAEQGQPCGRCRRGPGALLAALSLPWLPGMRHPAGERGLALGLLLDNVDWVRSG